MSAPRVWVVVDGYGKPYLDGLGQVWAMPTQKRAAELCFDDLQPAMYVPVFVTAPPRKRRRKK